MVTDALNPGIKTPEPAPHTDKCEPPGIETDQVMVPPVVFRSVIVPANAPIQFR
jgi:hypothetical protein